MHDPYGEVAWDDVTHLHSVTHEHTFAPNTGGDTWHEGETWHDPGGWTPQGVFDSLYDRGIRHFAISNYHPGAPTYPLDAFFDEVPSDALGCPNAEHVALRGDYCGVGSTFRSPSRHFDGTWQDLFDGIFDELQEPDGGGIVVNHPRRSGLDYGTLVERLTYDERVLGIEAWNHRGIVQPKYRSRGNALAIWDELLAGGHGAFGFFNPDYHARWDEERWGAPARGRNVLLVPARTEAAALRAYRHGRFYGALDGTGLRFERIDADETSIAVETNRARLIDFVVAGEVRRSVFGPSATYNRPPTDGYVRVEARDDTGERIFSQPIRYPEADDGG